MSKQQQPPELPAMLTTAEVATALRMTPQGIRDAVRRGDIHGIRVGRVIRIPKEELERVLSESAYHEDK